MSCDRQDVERIVEAALLDPDDRWDLRHYVDRIEPNYGEDATLARAVLDAIAAKPAGATFAELFSLLLESYRHLAPTEDELLR